MTQYTKGDGKTASEMMWDAGLGGAGPYVYCSCGKEHSLDPDLTEEEYNQADSFEYICLDGHNFVYDCDGCRQRLLKYEHFIWHNRNHIRRYLKTRIDQEATWAEQEKLLNTIAGI